MDDDRLSNYTHHQPGHPKAERAQSKHNASRAMARRLVYPLKTRHPSRPAGRCMAGDTEAHGHDDPELCRKMLPQDRQEARGCRARDVDRRNKCWNKKVCVGVFGEAESFDTGVESDVGYVDGESV